MGNVAASADSLNSSNETRNPSNTTLIPSNNITLQNVTETLWKLNSTTNSDIVKMTVTSSPTMPLSIESDQAMMYRMWHQMWWVLILLALFIVMLLVNIGWNRISRNRGHGADSPPLTSFSVKTTEMVCCLAFFVLLAQSVILMIFHHGEAGDTNIYLLLVLFPLSFHVLIYFGAFYVWLQHYVQTSNDIYGRGFKGLRRAFGCSVVLGIALVFCGALILWIQSRSPSNFDIQSVEMQIFGYMVSILLVVIAVIVWWASWRATREIPRVSFNKRALDKLWCGRWIVMLSLVCFPVFAFISLNEQESAEASSWTETAILLDRGIVISDMVLLAMMYIVFSFPWGESMRRAMRIPSKSMGLRDSFSASDDYDWIETQNMDQVEVHRMDL